MDDPDGVKIRELQNERDSLLSEIARLREIEKAARDFREAQDARGKGLLDGDDRLRTELTMQMVERRTVLFAVLDALQPQTERVTKMPVLPMRDGDLEPTQTEKED